MRRVEVREDREVERVWEGVGRSARWGIGSSGDEGPRRQGIR